MTGVYCCWVLGVLAHQTRREAAGRRAAIGVARLYTFGADLPSPLSCPGFVKLGHLRGEREEGEGGRR